MNEKDLVLGEIYTHKLTKEDFILISYSGNELIFRGTDMKKIVFCANEVEERNK